MLHSWNTNTLNFNKFQYTETIIWKFTDSEIDNVSALQCEINFTAWIGLTISLFLITLLYYYHLPGILESVKLFTLDL